MSDNASPMGHELDGLHVLIVEDNDDTRRLIVSELTYHGASAHTAGGAVEALVVRQTMRVDVIVSDLSMPGLTGYDLLHKLREQPDQQRRPTPVIALTALTGQREAGDPRPRGPAARSRSGPELASPRRPRAGWYARCSVIGACAGTPRPGRLGRGSSTTACCARRRSTRRSGPSASSGCMFTPVATAVKPNSQTRKPVAPISPPPRTIPPPLPRGLAQRLALRRPVISPPRPPKRPPGLMPLAKALAPRGK
jgi:CheY-like chemotaxis protein